MVLVVGLSSECPQLSHNPLELVAISQKLCCFWQAFSCGFVVLLKTIIPQFTHTHAHSRMHTRTYIFIQMHTIVCPYRSRIILFFPYIHICIHQVSFTAPHLFLFSCKCSGFIASV